MVYKVEKKKIEGDWKTLISIRQVELGFSNKKTVMWVDDEIFNEKWENKAHMEYAAAKDFNVRFIPKISTECALAFLNS